MARSQGVTPSSWEDGRVPNDDEVMLDAARSAKHFVVSIFLGRGRGYFRIPTGTLAIARFAGAYLEERIANHRLSMVYAVLPDDRGIFIARHIDAQLTQAQEGTQ